MSINLTKPVKTDMSKRSGIFSLSRLSVKQSDAKQSHEAPTLYSNASSREEPKRKRSISSPHNLNALNKLPSLSPPEHPPSPKKTSSKRHLSFTKLFRRSDRPSSHHQSMNNEDDDQRALEESRRQTELDFARILMTNPREIAADLCHVDSEPNLIQTICSPDCFSKDAIGMDRKIYRIDVANTRIATLSSLSGTAVLARDHQALEFLCNNLVRIRKQRTTLFRELDECLHQFKQNPDRIMSDSTVDSPRYPVALNEGGKVIFIVQDEDGEPEDLHWEMNSLQMTDTTSDESETEGPTPEEVEHLARTIRKTEGMRFKHKRKMRQHKKQSPHMPPPPNPLGHSKRALLRSHASVPSGLCQHRDASDHLLADLSHDSNQRQRSAKNPNSTNLPFNLLSLTGQLSWLVSEYVPRESSTYKWATNLIHTISRMSVTRATWLNLHQQLRETTELLYEHREKKVNPTINSASAQGEVAWHHLERLHRSVVLSDENMVTVTADTARHLLRVTDTHHNEEDRKLVHLSVLLGKKLHLAYVCDLLLWRAHKILFMSQADAPDETAKHQLIDFRIRHMQLRLDQANVQNWSPNVIDWIICWIHEAITVQPYVTKGSEDRFCLDELSTLKTSIKQFGVLVQHLCASEFVSDNYLSDTSPETTNPNNSSGLHRQLSQQHPHYHPHLHHHGAVGQLQDLRPLDADRCCQTYSALVRQVYEHAMSKRPLTYFAERALYDIAMELNCQIDWKERLNDLLNELTSAYNEWEQLLMAKLHTNFQQVLFGSKSPSLPTHTENDE